MVTTGLWELVLNIGLGMDTWEQLGLGDERSVRRDRIRYLFVLCIAWLGAGVVCWVAYCAGSYGILDDFLRFFSLLLFWRIIFRMKRVAVRGKERCAGARRMHY